MLQLHKITLFKTSEFEQFSQRETIAQKSELFESRIIENKVNTYSCTDYVWFLSFRNSVRDTKGCKVIHRDAKECYLYKLIIFLGFQMFLG